MVILDKEDLVNLVKGTYCLYVLLEEFSKKRYGYYTGGIVDGWIWNSSKLKELDEDTLIKIYGQRRNYIIIFIHHHHHHHHHHMYIKQFKMIKI